MESNQNLIRANKQPAYNAMKTDGAQSRGAKAPCPQTASVLGMQMSGRTRPQGREPCDAPQESHLGPRARAPGYSTQL